MTLLEPLIMWLLGKGLNWLLTNIMSSVAEYQDQVALDKQRGITNAANIKAYNEAKSRQDRINAAIDLLNGVRQP